MSVKGELAVTWVEVTAPEGPEDVGVRAEHSPLGYVPTSDVLQPYARSLGTSRENLS